MCGPGVDSLITRSLQDLSFPLFTRSRSSTAAPKYQRQPILGARMGKGARPPVGFARDLSAPSTSQGPLNDSFHSLRYFPRSDLVRLP